MTTIAPAMITLGRKVATSSQLAAPPVPAVRSGDQIACFSGYPGATFVGQVEQSDQQFVASDLIPIAIACISLALVLIRQ